jgi:chitodextrinase
MKLDKVFMLCIFVFCLITSGALYAGGLQVSPINPRYFSDADGNAVYLTGSHTWNNFQDMATAIMDYPAYLNFLVSYNHNFFRLWAWEESVETFDGDRNRITPNVYARTGPGVANDGLPKFDVTKFNQDYFDRMRERIIAAQEQGIYVSIMLFDGWSVIIKDSVAIPWTYHPFNKVNNINGINGDTNNNGFGEETQTLQIPAIISLQQDYIKKVIDTVNDLDNVLYEVSNESQGNLATTQWEYSIINYVKQYEAGKPNQHPVGMTVEYPNGNNSDLLNSPADWISPNSSASYPYDYRTNPPPANGSKVIIVDTDHLWGIGGDRYWAWKSFTRGLNILYMDSYLIDPGAVNESLRKNMGYILSYAEKMGLIGMTPQESLSSTKYCLANIGQEYLVYAPSSGTFTVNLAFGTYSVEWLNPSTGKITSGAQVTGGGQKSFTPPFSGDAVLYLINSGVVDTTAPTTPSGVLGSAISSTQINLSWTGSIDNVGVAGYNIFRNGTQIGTSTVESYQDKGLTPDTEYTYAVSAYDTSGNVSEKSQQISVRTQVAPLDTTPPVISSIVVSSITSKSAKITWATNEPSDSQVEYGKTVQYGTKSDLNSTMVTSHSVTLYNLSSWTRYHFRVLSKDRSGNLSVSSDKSFTTRW